MPSSRRPCSTAYALVKPVTPPPSGCGGSVLAVAVQPAEPGRADQERARPRDVSVERAGGRVQVLDAAAVQLAPLRQVEGFEVGFDVQRGQPVQAVDRAVGAPAAQLIQQGRRLDPRLKQQRLDVGFGQPVGQFLTHAALVEHDHHPAALRRA